MGHYLRIFRKVVLAFSQMRLLSQTVPNFDQMYIYKMVKIKNSLT